MTTMQSSRPRRRADHRVTRWYPKQQDDVIIQRWTEACSEKHRDCLGCAFVDDCEDVVDRLIACMDVLPTGHREMVPKRDDPPSALEGSTSCVGQHGNRGNHGQRKKLPQSSAADSGRLRQLQTPDRVGTTTAHKTSWVRAHRQATSNQ